MKKLRQIKKMAIIISGETKACLDGLPGKIEILTPDKKYERNYNINSCSLTFVENGIQYVIPAFNGVENVLVNNGFMLNLNMYVPFGYGGYPVEHQEEWELLKTIYQGN